MRSAFVLALAASGCQLVFPQAPSDAATGAGFMLRLDGEDDLVTLLRPVELSFTIEMWIRTNTGTKSTDWHTGIGLVYADANGSANDFGLALAGELAAFGIGNPDETLRSSTSVTTGQWYHLAATRDHASGALELYVDGTRHARANHQNLEPLVDTQTVQIGYATSVGAEVPYFRGDLDELRIWSVVRSAAEIDATRHVPLVGNEPGLVRYYRFDDGSGQIATDSSPNDMEASLGAGPQAPTWLVSDAPINPE